MAQSTVSATQCCLKTEVAMSNVVGGLYPAMVETETFGTYKAIQDSQAMAPFAVIPTQGPAKPAAASNRTVDVKYLKYDCAAAANTDVDFYACTDATATPETYGFDRTTVADYVSHSFAIEARAFDDTCTTTAIEDLAVKMQHTYRALMRSANEKVTTKLYAAMGNYYAASGDTPVSSVTTPTALKLFSATGQPQPVGLFALTDEYKKQLPGSPLKPIAISGSSKLRAYEFAKEFFRGNVDGFDSTKSDSPFVGYVDHQVDAVIAAAGGVTTENILSFLPGSIHIVEWFAFEGDKTIEANGRHTYDPRVSTSGNLVRQKIDLGQVFGGSSFVVDMQIKLSECAEKVVYTFRKDFDLWSLPQDAFDTDCNQAHNYRTLWTAGCANIGCSDI